MTHPSVEWTLNQVETVVNSVAADFSQADGSDVAVRRVDRGNNQYFDGSGSINLENAIHQRAGALEQGVYIGAGYTGGEDAPIGTEYDLDIDVVVGVRLEGLTALDGHGGHVDPSGDWGIPWREFVDRVESAVYDGRKFPAADGGSSVSFTHFSIENKAPQSHQWAQYYRHDFDIVFDGFEEL